LGIPIPQPIEPQQFSGKIIVRMPPTLHESLTRIAELEGVSLNQYMVSSLARCAGRDEANISKKKVREKQTA